MQLAIYLSDFKFLNTIEHRATFSGAILDIEWSIMEWAENLVVEERTFPKRSTEMRAFIGHAIILSVDFDNQNLVILIGSNLHLNFIAVLQISGDGSFVVFIGMNGTVAVACNTNSDETQEPNLLAYFPGCLTGLGGRKGTELISSSCTDSSNSDGCSSKHEICFFIVWFYFCFICFFGKNFSNFLVKIDDQIFWKYPKQIIKFSE